MKKEIPTTEYMVDGWDRGPSGSHPYKRGSRHNKIGMWIMWIFYGIVIVQLLHVFTVIPFFPITFTILSGLGFIYYVAWRAT
tara:strand:- start:344 stop:589 length:246 start_codon:yes stop_codon:yes gene_type:complete